MELSEMDEMKTEVLPEEKVNPDLVGTDLPPEYCRYRDEGCDLSYSCLNCPFPNCVYEEPGGRQRWVKKIRAREMARLFTTKGKSVKELALIFGVSQRTVQRALKVALGPDLSGKRGRQNE
jgi:DNA-binding transcriptional ArsR family regulator